MNSRSRRNSYTCTFGSIVCFLLMGASSALNLVVDDDLVVVGAETNTTNTSVSGGDTTLLCFEGDQWNANPCPAGPNKTLPAQVYIGVYFTVLTNVDSFASTFTAQGIVWYKWRTCQFMRNIPYRPFLTLYMENSMGDVVDPIPQRICPQDISDTPCPVCNVPGDGWSYYSYKFLVEFDMNMFYKSWPLDVQFISISFEDFVFPCKMVTLIPDPDSGVSPDINPLGFLVGDMAAYSSTNNYTTNFGKELNVTPAYSRCTIGVHISRSPTFYALRILPPALIVQIVSIIVIFLDPTEIQARLGAAVSGLLALVSLCIGTSAKLPDIGDVSITDIVYDWFFFLTFVVIAESVFVNRKIQKFQQLNLDKALDANHSAFATALGDVSSASAVDVPLPERDTLTEKDLIGEIYSSTVSSGLSTFSDDKNVEMDNFFEKKLKKKLKKSVNQFKLTNESKLEFLQTLETARVYDRITVMGVSLATPLGVLLISLCAVYAYKQRND
ncbi:hypothetical protein Pelo_12482 [Pelomyxa schiedti]|nr:hypothetical protein Pelo_12482 [Pelomyxa schiedti]